MGRSLSSRLKSLVFAALAAAWGASCLLGPSVAAAQTGSLTATIIPRDDWPPAPVTDLTATPGAEGQLLLEWTAPDSNGNLFADKSAAAAYQVRVATFSVDSVGGSTTAWWNSAVSVTALPFPALSATLPAPAAPGVRESLLLNRLRPGASYYAMIRSNDGPGYFSDSDLPSRTPSAQAFGLIADAAPAAPTNLSVVSVTSHSFTVGWASSTAFDLDLHRVYVDSTPPFDFADAFVTAVDSPTLTASFVTLATGTYWVRVTAVDEANPGAALESAPTDAGMALVELIRRAPQAPFGLAVSTAGASVILRWMPVTRFADLASFADPANALESELANYRVYRATSAIAATWTQLVQLATNTLTWTDLAGGPQYYYCLRAENNTALSDRSMVRSIGNLSALMVAPDDRSFLEIYSNSVSPFEGAAGQPMTAYQVSVASRPQDLDGRIVKSLEFTARQGGQQADPSMTIPALARLTMRYESAGGQVIPAGVAPLAGLPATPNNLGVYWWNGSAWVQLYGAVDEPTQTVTVEVKHFGVYQLRVVERATGFSFNSAGLSNKTVTPNGDGKNDDVVFFFDNPRDSQVRLRIFDIRGRLVAENLPNGPTSNSRVWNGRSNGHPVPGGVYIYQIEAEGQSFSGTLLVVR